jgi:hypothetical protein
MHSAGVMMQPTPARATKVLLQLVEAKERAVDAGGGFEPNMFKFGCGSMTRNPRGVDPAALGVRCDGTEGQTAHSVDSPVQPHVSKIFRFPPDPNQIYNPRRLPPHKGRIAIVTDAGWDAVDAGNVGRALAIAGRVEPCERFAAR